MTIYLTGVASPEARSANRSDLGVIVGPGGGTSAAIPSFGCYGADNGCFSKGDQFDADVWLAWLNTLPRAGCLFATAPDVVGDAAATLTRSAPYLETIRGMGFPAALVAQDGLEDLEVPWDTFDVLFIGGSTEWKLSPAAASLMAEAKARGKWVHVGRVNSYKRLRWSADNLADSADGTFLAFGPKANWPRLLGWLDRMAQEEAPIAA